MNMKKSFGSLLRGFAYCVIVSFGNNNYAIAKTSEVIKVIGNELDAKNIAGSANVITKDQIKKYNYNDINRVLRQVPGVNLQEEDGFGNRPNISFRGGRSERSADVTLMEDGILIAPAPYSASSAYYFPRVNRMEAVEVRKGSSSIKYGPRTTSGVVNLLSTSIPNKREGKANFALGNYSTKRSELNYGDNFEKFSYVMDVSDSRSKGFKSIDVVGGNTGYEIQDVMGKFRLSSNPDNDLYQYIQLKLGATEEDSNETYLGLTEEDFNNNPFRRYAATQKDKMLAEHQQYQIQYFIEPNDQLNITTTAYLNNFQRNWYKLQSVTIAENKKGLKDALIDSNYLDVLKGNADLLGVATDNLTLRANKRDYSSKGIATNLNYNFKNRNLEHDFSLGVRYHHDYEARFQHEDEYSIIDGVMQLVRNGEPGSNADRKGSANATAIFIEDKIKLGDFSIIPGLRYENISLKREDYKNNSLYENNLDVFVPAIAFIYSFTDSLNGFFGVHRGFAPPAPSANIDQDYEKSVNYEAGFKFLNKGFKAELVGFFNDYKNLLGEETLSSGNGNGSGEQFNGGEVNLYGLEFALEYDLAKFFENITYKFPVSFNYSFTDAEFASSFSSEFDEWGDVTKGDELPYIAKHQFYISSAIEADNWSHSLSLKYVDEMRTEAGSGEIISSAATDAALVMDLASEYKINSNLKLFSTIYNLSNEKYVVARRPYGARPAAPRMFLAGVKLNF